MACLSAEKLKEMEAEMNRFEQEIALPLAAPPPPPPPPPPEPSRPVIGVNTYNRIAEQLQKQQQQQQQQHYNVNPMVGMFIEAPPTGPIAPASSGPSLQFIPHQLQRAPPMRPPPPMNMPPMGPAPVSTQSLPPMMGMGPAGPINGPPPPGPNPPMMNPGNFMPGPGPGFIPPAAPGVGPPAMRPIHTQSSSSVISVAPAIYAAPPVKAKKDHSSSAERNAHSEPPETLEPPVPVIEPSIPTPPLPIKKQIGPPVMVTVAQPPNLDEVTVNPPKKKEKDKKKKIIRTAGGQSWEDVSLIEWDTDDFRIFCGDLGNDVTDEVLTRAFSRFPSFMKAKVIRDKRNNKTKGYGFVSFKDPQDFIKAMKEMNGKYVGSRPIKLRKSTWKDRNLDIVRKKFKEKQRLGLR